ncbi:Hypothetical predicted protein [Cloeon dipterum]|uniref:C2H2-type domain-containing protein n=1 Tax=Cloeon dipterum TaxID=197152 RepID=A0A8S1C0L9_9INSE|nr:Hypothetical predicted protein [Cloeon dipterum]
MAFDPGDAIARALKMMDQFYVKMMQCNILSIQSFKYECFNTISQESYLQFCDQLLLVANEAQQIRDGVFNTHKTDASSQTDPVNITLIPQHLKSPNLAESVSPPKCIKVEKPLIPTTEEDESFTDVPKQKSYKRNDIICDYCELKFNSLEKMQQHVNIAHSEDFTSTFYPCRACSLIFLSLDELSEHSVCVHNVPETAEQSENQLCPYCCEVYSNWTNFIMHLEEEHQTLVCKTCHTFCSDKEALKEHEKKSHMTGITQEKINEIVVPVMEPKPISAASLKDKPVVESPVKKRGRPKGSTLVSKTAASEVVSCKFCSARFNNEDSLKKHVVYKHDTEELQCSECKLKFKRASAYKSHMNLFHQKAIEAKAALAKLIPVEVKQKPGLKKVFLKPTGKDDVKKPLSVISTLKGHTKPNCEICGELCNRTEDKEIHKDFHTTHIPDKFLCLFCKAPAMPQKELRTHIKSEHRYRCPFCALTFWWKVNLESHLKQLHPVKNCCIMCGLNKEGEELRQHIVEAHNVKKMYICKVCDSEHASVMEMREHEKTHALDPLHRLTCDFCNEEFGRKKSLKGHVLRHIFGSFSCSLCGLQCKTEDVLKQHMVGHQKSQFACLCGESFETKADLQMHEKITPCKPFFNQPIHRADLFVEVSIEDAYSEQTLPVNNQATITKVKTCGVPKEEVFHISIFEVPAQGSKNFLDSLAAANKANQLILPRQPILILNSNGAEATLIENKAPGIMSWVEENDSGISQQATE